ncbi:MAG: methionyl-tRNA formyltransferase [Bacteroidota bacterium]
MKTNTPLRIVFMGTPEFAVGSLEGILQAGFEVVGVVTAPDRPAGRGRKVRLSAVKEFALQHELPVLQPENLKDSDFIESLETLKANLQVVVAFRMLPKVVWAMPEFGTFNLHASLLPKYRGAAPINWAIIRGENQTGVTTFFIDEKIDTGHIIAQKTELIYESDNVGSLHDRLKLLGADLVVETCQRISEGNFSTTPQDDAEQSSAPKIHKETCRINWDRPLNIIHNHIRGLSPYPGAWCVFENDGKALDIKIFASEMLPVMDEIPLGTLTTTKNEMSVKVDGGYLKILEVQFPGKKRMKIDDVLRGLVINENARIR